MADNDWPVVVQNMVKAWAVWRRMTRILSKEGTDPWVSNFFFGDVIQSVLLFGVETWVVTPHMGRFLGVSRNRWCGNWWGGSRGIGQTGNGSTP